jgi:hypothetical protein
MSDSNDDGRDLAQRLQGTTSLTTPATDDGFAGYVDTYEGGDDDGFVNQHVIEGTRIKFTNDFRWVDSEDTPLDPNLELVVVKIKRYVQKWIDEKPVETRELAPNQPYPDIKAMNDACPEAEWHEAFGKLRGPWQAETVLYFSDAALDMYTFIAPTRTVGSIRAVNELVDKINRMRRYRGAGILAVVRLSSTPMPTQYGGRLRPHFNVRFVAPDGGTVTALTDSRPNKPRGAAALLDQFAEVIPPAAKPVPAHTPAMTAMKSVSEPSRAEEMNDTIPF